MTIRIPAIETCGFCEYIAGTKECAFIRRGPLVSSLVNRTQYETGALLIIPNHHFPTVLDLPPRTLAAAALESQLLGRALVEEFGATGLNIYQNNGIDANQHFPHYHLHVVPRFPGSDSTRIYLHTDFSPVSIAEQHEIGARIRRGCERIALSRAALVVIDVQKAIDAGYHAVHGPRNNVDAEKKIARLLAQWRENQRPVIHIRHDSTSADSAYRPGQAGNAFKDEVMPLAGETIIPKTTNSAFIGTQLERHLRSSGIDTLVVAGVSTNNSLEATVRMAGNLGFNTYLVGDACFTFARPDFAGTLRSAEEVHAMSLANLHGEYCTVVNADQVIGTDLR